MTACYVTLDLSYEREGAGASKAKKLSWMNQQKTYILTLSVYYRRPSASYVLSRNAFRTVPRVLRGQFSISSLNELQQAYRTRLFSFLRCSSNTGRRHTCPGRGGGGKGLKG